MKLVTFSAGSHEKRVGIMSGNGIVDVRKANADAPTTMIELAGVWDNWHAEFEAGDGVTTDAVATWVAGASLYIFPAGGSVWLTGILGASYYFPKWTGTRVIVEFETWDGAE